MEVTVLKDIGAERVVIGQTIVELLRITVEASRRVEVLKRCWRERVTEG